MLKSESITKLAGALAKAQGEMENADKKSVNPHFRSKYADLAEIINTVRPVLARHGLSVTQFPSFDGTLAHVETIIAHESGEWMSGTTSSPVQKSDPQGIGSATTYLRRYSLAAVCNIAQEDDDANSASKGRQPDKQTTQPAKPPQRQQPAPSMPAPNQARKLASKQTIADLRGYYKDDPEEVMLDDVNEMLRKAAEKQGKKFELLDALDDLTEPLAQWLIKNIEDQIGGQSAA